MTIEQSLVRSGKTQGGLDNITHKEGVNKDTMGAQSSHCCQYSEAHRKLT